MKKKKLDEYNNLDILSSIWILSCNDENPQITYQGLKYRLGLPDDFDVKALVQSRGELFRKRTTTKLLNPWKQDMLNNKHLPSWIRDTTNEEQRKQLINDLTIEDVFRSQFRAEANSPRSDIEVINWGLQHIERLRNAQLESKKTRISIFSSIWIPVLSTLVAVIAVISSFIVQYTNNKNQVLLKQYEIQIRPKQVGYADFMKSITPSYYSALDRNSTLLYKYIDNMESAYYTFEPFLTSNDRRKIWDQILQYNGFCATIIKSDSLSKVDNSIDSFIWYRNYFREYLYSALFLSDQNSKQVRTIIDSVPRQK